MKRSSETRRQCAVWLAGSAVMPFTAYPALHAFLPPAGLDLGVVLILGTCWSVCSFLLAIYVKKHVR